MIRFLELSKRFGGQLAVDSLTLDIDRGEVVALLGPNGSGKTTSLKAAAGLVRPTRGDVLLGKPGLSARLPDARRTCAFLPQRVAFPDQLSGAEVVEFYGELRGQARGSTTAALRMAALNGASGRAVATYSGGMKQRLGLAVALAAAAPILLLDEPTAALDPEGLCAFYGLVEQRRGRGHTVLFSSHQMGDVERLADRFAILVNGRLITTLTSHELTARLGDRGVMKISVDRHALGLVECIRRLAPAATVAAHQLIVPGPARIRPAVLDMVRAAGVEIRGLTAEDGRLESFYRELIGGSS